MKRIISLIIVSLVIVTEQAWANPISKEQARRNVEAFLKERGKSVAIQQPSGVRHKQAPKSEKEALYIFNLGNKEGYVIASGDDCAPAVLGYSTTGEYDAEKAPENMKAWLEEYKNQIEFMQRNGIVSVREASTDYPAIKPLLTTKWDQGDPYNISCPDFFDTGSKCVTGCVATAMAQILYFHRKNSVNETQMQLPGYPCRTYWTDQGGYVKVEPIFSGSPIDWDNMLDSYNGSETDAQKKAVADLMAYCGSSVNMDYGRYESAAKDADVPSALKRIFSYSENTTLIYRKNYTNDSEWDKLIYNQLKRGMPVYYSGGDNSSNKGHAFVCDGYNDGFFHINWGWSGNPDNYYRLTVLNPQNQGIGSTGSSYNSGQAAIIECIPEEKEVKLSTLDLSLIGKTEFSASSFDISVQVPVKITLGNNTENQDFIFAIGMYHKGELKNILTEQNIKLSTGQKNIQQFEISVNANLKEGVYKFIPMSKENNTDVWYKNEYSTDRYITLTVMNGTLSFCVGKNAASVDVISFADSEVKRICIENWDTDGDGEISYVEAKKVTDFGKVFAGTSISTFDEAQYFTGIKKFGLGFGIIGCPSLVSIKLPETIDEIKESAFYGCTSLKQINIPNSVICIGSLAFADCVSLETINLNNVKTIGNQAFMRCNSFTSIEIPTSVTSIGTNSFGGCQKLKDIIVNQQNNAYCSIDGVLYTKDKKELVQYPSSRKGEGIIIEGTESILESAFYLSQITSLTVPKTVKKIDREAFRYCFYLEKITLPDYLPKLSSGVFWECTKLASINIPQSIVSIGQSCFIGCKSLYQIEIPVSVAQIDSYAFSNSGIQKVISFMKLPCSIDATVFNNISSSTILYVPSNSISAYQKADYWKDFSQILPIEESQDEAYVVFDNGTLTFCYDNKRSSRKGNIYGLNKNYVLPDWNKHCNQVTKVIIEESFKKVRPKNMYAWFSDCGNLNDIQGIENINTSEVTNMQVLFYQCYSLQELDLSTFNTSKVDDMGFMFGYCQSLKKLNIESFDTKNVTNMAGLFDQCLSLPHIDLSNFNTKKVLSMSYMFTCCYNLESLDLSSFETSNVRTMDYMFDFCNKLQDLNLNNFDTQRVDNMDEMFGGCDKLRSIILGERTILKGKGTFGGCNQLKDVTVYNPTPSAIESTTFSQSIRTQATLHVPLGHIQDYLAAEYWKEFSSIVEIDERTAQTMTLTSLPAMMYGDNNYKLPTTTNEGLQIVWSSEGDAVSISGNYLIVKNAGSATVVASQEGNTQYQPFSRSFTLTINKAKLTVTAKSFSKKQYEEVPTFEAEYSGFKYNDTENVLTKKPEFVCSATATSGPGKYAIYVSGAEARNYDIKYVNGVLTVTEAESTVRKGDVNSDGSVDVADVVATVNYILGRPSAGFVVAAADINGDKSIDVADVVGMVNIILGRNAARSVEKNEAEAMKNDVLALDCGFGNRFVLSLENQGRYVAAQFDVELSDGLEIESVTLNKERFGEHRVAYAQIGERLYRVMVYSMDGAAIEGERGEILAMQLSGDGAFRIKDIVFVTSDLGVKRFADLQNGTTGIRSLDAGRPVDVYGVDGRLIRRQTKDLKGLKKGVYVVDGQKVVVK